MGQFYIGANTKRPALPHPGVSTAQAARSEGPQQSFSVEEEACPCGRDSGARISVKRPSAGGDSTMHALQGCGLDGIRMGGVD
ncbi:hypothetical protein XACLG98_2100001 [Xanthomonas citri pv. citri]|nr:hypothetical protein XACLG98_2100001 [Xanthomonas citri pv. citri]